MLHVLRACVLVFLSSVFPSPLFLFFRYYSFHSSPFMCSSHTITCRRENMIKQHYVNRISLLTSQVRGKIRESAVPPGSFSIIFPSPPFVLLSFVTFFHRVSRFLSLSFFSSLSSSSSPGAACRRQGGGAA